MANGYYNIAVPKNEPVFSYEEGSKERVLLIEELTRQYENRIEIPLIIGGKEIFTGRMGKNVCPHEHGHVLAEYHEAGEKEVEMAIEAALSAKEQWENLGWYERGAIFLKAAELVSTKYRYIINAATMLNQGKNVHQAEIDATCETADFFRFNSYYMQEVYSQQPVAESPGMWNRLDYRALEGFILAVSPFNFASLAVNLAAAPAIMGNVVLWKPASAAVLSGYYMMKVLMEAGLPAGVINFIPGPGRVVGPTALASRYLAGINFTGSTDVFQDMWERVGKNIRTYGLYPRLVGETGGKGFIMVHSSADRKAAAVALTRGAFEYQGQKCSAASRAYISRSTWPDIYKEMKTIIDGMRHHTGSPLDFKFFNAVIDENSYTETMKMLDEVRASSGAEIIFGGNGDKSKGYFIEPTVILAHDPHFVTMEKELFAPVLTVYIYEDDRFEETLRLCNETSPYGLTGAIFANDRVAVMKAFEVLRHAAGNFYINDKPTGAVVGQQPFGGARLSGTNDKSGSSLNLLRWVSPRTIKETFVPPMEYDYPFMK